MNAEGLQLNA